MFSGADQWGALPDGSLWVARVYENRVDWRDPAGQWTRGEPLPDRVLEVTRYDRELFVRRFPPELRSTAEQLPFAPVKPPFEAGFTGPAGDAGWRRAARPSTRVAATTWWTGRGRLREEIRVPGPGRIIAVGDGRRAGRRAVPRRRPTDAIRPSGPRGRQHAALVTITRSGPEVHRMKLAPIVLRHLC